MRAPASPSPSDVQVTALPGETALVSLLGEHDMATAWEVRNVITSALDQDFRPVIDLSETEFIDSSVIHVLFEKRVSLLLPKGAPVRRALEITGVLDVLPVYRSRAEVIYAVKWPRDENTERGETWDSC